MAQRLSVSLAAAAAMMLGAYSGLGTTRIATAESAPPTLPQPAKPKQTGAVAIANLPGPDGGVAWGRAEGIIDAKPADILAVIHDYGQYAGLFPHFEKSRVLSQRGENALVYLEANILAGIGTLWGQVRMSASQPASDVHVVEAKLMKGKGNMAELLARWEVHTIDAGQRAQVAFQILVDPDLPVPNGLVSDQMKNSAGMAFYALRKRLTQPTARRPDVTSRTSASM